MTINRNNYETWFLLYIDRELNDADREMVDHFVLQHPDLEKELNALKQTIVLPSTVEFENKDILYRQESKRRLIPVYLWRVAAALIILLAGAWFLLMTGNPRRQDQLSYDSGQLAVRQPVPEKGTNSKSEPARGDNALPEKSADQHPLPGRLKESKKPAIQQQPDHYLTPPDSDPQKDNEQKTVEKGNADHKNEDSAFAMNQNMPAVITGHPLTINYPPLTINHPQLTVNETPSTVNRQPSTSASGQSILVFNANPVSRFFRKHRAPQPEEEIADNHGRKIRISLFQFSVKK